MSQSKRKTLVLGLDGATFDIIDRLRGEGHLPHLSSLIAEGARAPLRSTIMPNSFPAWATITTGVNPGKHGIFWSLVRDGVRPDSFRLMNSTDIGAKRIWEILGENGYRVGVVNVPTEYPPYPVNGFLICGALTPDASSEFAYPASLKEEILDLAPGFPNEIEYGTARLDELARQIRLSIDNRERMILYLLREKPWDFFFAVFTETDLVQHRYWAGIDPEHPDYERFRSQYGSFVHDVYKRLDAAIGRILGRALEDTAIFIVSDHGFGSFYQSFSLPRWLIDHGYLVLKKKPLAGPAGKLKGGSPIARQAKLWKAALQARLSRLKKQSTVRGVREGEAAKTVKSFQQIEWPSTRAYFTQDFGIQLNVQGREPSGIVCPGEEELRLKREIQDKLRRLRFSNGRPVFEAVLAKEEAFSGPFLSRAPDLIIPINYAQAPPRPEAWPYAQTHPTLNGTHAPLGVFIARGPGIKKDYRAAEMALADLTPTLLYYIGVPIAEDMDGRVCGDLYDPEFRKQTPILKKGSSLKTPPASGGKKYYGGAESRQVEDKLRSLGYIE